MNQSKKIFLFYKSLTNRGGAELLILKEYKYFKKLNYNVKIITYRFNKASLFAETINYNDLVVFGSSNNFINWLRLLFFIKKNSNGYYLVSSGRIEIFLASLFIKIKYSIHIHQPLFMSSRDKDKYSIFFKNKFEFMTKGNPLKENFNNIQKKIKIFEKIKINLQSILTILSYKKAHKTFVLSDYSKKEKKVLFGIEAIVEKGAIEETVFNYKPKKIFPEFKNVKFKFLTICRLDNTKRVDILIKACKIFYKHEKSFILVIGGVGPELKYFKNLTKKYNLEKNIFFMGFILEKDKLDFLKWADLFISIDSADYTITTIEALALGTKCLVSKERDITSKIVKTGLIYFTEPNAEETAKKIIKVIKINVSLNNKDLKNIFRDYTWLVYCKNILKHIIN